MNGVLDVSAAAFEEIKERLRLCGEGGMVKTMPRREAYPDAVMPPEKAYEPVEVIDLGEVGLRRETDEDMRAYLVHRGKIIKKGAGRPDNDSDDRRAG